jgi:hypothetical protein
MLDWESFSELLLSRMRSTIAHALLIGLAGVAVACASMGSADEIGDRPAGVGGASTSGSGYGAEEPDGSIDVASDGDPAPNAKDYAGSCGLGAQNPRDAMPPCVAGAEHDGCTSLQPSEGGMSSGYITCQLVATDGAVVPTCLTPGEGTYNQPCMSALNCGGGLGCAVVASPGATPDNKGGACLDYCCGDLEECPKDTYCTLQSMAEAPDVTIPVCILASKCTLLDDTTCPEGLTCAIVRADGTTSCVVPGTGKDGEECNSLGFCAAGFTCLKLVGKCKQLCRLDHPEDCPMGSTCLSGSGEYPDNYGTCTAGDGYN